MIIDFHTHVFPDKIAEKTIDALSHKASIPPFSDGKVSGLIEKMEVSGVDIAVNLPVATNPAQFDSVNRFAASINATFADKDRRIVSFAGIHPDCDDLEGKMRWIKSQGFLGIKLHPDYQETFFDDEKYIAILTLARELDLVVVTHAGFDAGYPDSPIRCTPERARKVIERVGHSKLVLAHLGANELTESVIEHICGLDVYLDTAYVLRFVSQENFMKILAKHGEDRILFASDSPWSDMGGDAEILRSYNLGKETEEKIFCSNAKKLLGIR